MPDTLSERTTPHIIGIDASRASLAQKTGTEHYSFQLICALLKKVIAQPTAQTQTNSRPAYRLYTTPRVDKRIESLVGKNSSRARVQLKKMFAPRLWTQGRLALEMLLHPPEVLFVPSHTIPWIHPKKVVVTCHDLAFELFPDAYTTKQIRELKRATKQMVRWASAIITPSQATKNDLVELYHADPARVHVIWHGYDKSAFVPQSPDTVARVTGRYNITTPYILSVGRIERRKNTLRLVKAFHQLRTTQHNVNPSAQLVLIGKDGFGAQEIRDYIDTHHLRDSVRMLGYVDESAYVALLAGATALAYPSLAEGFGMPLLEAFATGTPVLTSKGSSLEEVSGPNAALLVDAQDEHDIARGLQEMMTNEQLRTTLVAHGRTRLAQFSWEECARQTQDLLERVYGQTN